MAFARAVACACVLHLRDALDLQGRGLGGKRGLLQRLRVRLFRRIGHVEVGRVGGKLVRGGQPDPRILRRLAGHGDRAFGHRLHRFVPDVGGRHASLPFAQEHAQPDLHPLGALGMFQPAGPYIHRDRGAAPDKHVGLLGTGGAGSAQQTVGDGGQVVGVGCHAKRLRLATRWT